MKRRIFKLYFSKMYFFLYLLSSNYSILKKQKEKYSSFVWNKKLWSIVTSLPIIRLINWSFSILDLKSNFKLTILLIIVNKTCKSIIEVSLEIESNGLINRRFKNLFTT